MRFMTSWWKIGDGGMKENDMIVQEIGWDDLTMDEMAYFIRYRIWMFRQAE
jgi:hypothetical protein